MARPTTSLVPKVEDMLAIDIARLRRSGLTSPGSSGEITWSRSRSSVMAAVGYVLQEDGLRLKYDHTLPGGAAQRINEVICIVTTPSHFGGQRHWFECPSCANRCRVIYGGSHFRCRQCHGARYLSQYESEPIRISRRRWRIRRKLEELVGKPWALGLDDGFPARPRRMRWRTFRRLEALDRELAGRWCLGVNAWLERTDPQRPRRRSRWLTTVQLPNRGARRSQPRRSGDANRRPRNNRDQRRIARP